ncbi:hypothetical protein SDC9_111389 [bioreactor metagenome]|uniref:N-acetyltransferase domain-containing protein n=1 Tax=bioreactor metagenome TaxID=1076179 RepID=A0A645BGV8_9ZZZZ
MVTLRDIDETNVESCAELKCLDEQCQFTNSPVWSLLQSAYTHIKDKSKLYSIYADNTLVGMIRLDFTLHDGFYMFTNLLIDKDYQRKGYAQKAVYAALEIFRQDGRHKTVKIHVAYENANAIHLYKKCGFTEADNYSEENVFLTMKTEL